MNKIQLRTKKLKPEEIIKLIFQRKSWGVQHVIIRDKQIVFYVNPDTDITFQTRVIKFIINCFENSIYWSDSIITDIAKDRSSEEKHSRWNLNPEHIKLYFETELEEVNSLLDEDVKECARHKLEEKTADILNKPYSGELVYNRGVVKRELVGYKSFKINGKSWLRRFGEWLVLSLGTLGQIL